jgi:beta-aspartyl-peptidase (threonine type)
MRVVLARSAVEFLRLGTDPESAVKQAVELLAAKTGRSGGLILIDRRGGIGYARDTTHMPVCAISGSGQIRLDT